jgi:hypothetical protein
MKESTASAILRLPPSQQAEVICFPGTLSVRRCCSDRNWNMYNGLNNYIEIEIETCIIDDSNGITDNPVIILKLYI